MQRLAIFFWGGETDDSVEGIDIRLVRVYAALQCLAILRRVYICFVSVVAISIWKSAPTVECRVLFFVRMFTEKNTFIYCTLMSSGKSINRVVQNYKCQLFTTKVVRLI